MLVKNYTHVGFQCPHCGNVENKRINLFDYSSDISEIKCGSCRKTVAALQKSNRIKYNMEFSCIECGKKHIYKIPINEFWHTSFKELNCAETNESVFAIGKDDYIAQMLNENFYEDEAVDVFCNMKEILQYADELSQSEFMDIINHFDKLSHMDKILCSCGEKNICIQLDEDGIYISCPKCENELYFSLSTADEIKDFLSLTEIILD